MRALRRADGPPINDPAPSRLSYRVERLKLTPAFRFGTRVVLPFVLVAGAIGYWASIAENRQMVADLGMEIRDAIAGRPEFQVKLMAVDGASPRVAEDIRKLLPIDFPVSSFDLELDEILETVGALHAVSSAEVKIRTGGVLQVDVVERQPAVLRRGDRGLELLDATGILVGPAPSRAHYVGLPVIAGEGAHDAVAEALDLFAVTGPLRGRLRGFERMGARRWDVVLDRGQRILLPETGAVQALERTIAMDQAINIKLMSRDIVAVDLRLPHRPVLRMSDQAAQQMRQIKAFEAGGE
ncbi:MAG: cell division protein FtsQ/DivIB [Pelagimonas sp.]